MEHTDNPAESEKTAKEHIAEIKDYYTHLLGMENKAKQQGKLKKSDVENTWISKKIKKLMKEGYEQKQAVAIAMDMYKNNKSK